MTLPRIIIPARRALKSVPPSIRDAALGVGASKMQSVFHHVLPLATPGILTGRHHRFGQALGETAPLLLIGMVAFVREYPAAYTPDAGLFGEASTALPVQVSLTGTQRADPGFVESGLRCDYYSPYFPSDHERSRDLLAPQVRASVVGL